MLEDTWFGKEQGLDRRGKVRMELWQHKQVDPYPLMIVRMYEGRNPLSYCKWSLSLRLYGDA